MLTLDPALAAAQDSPSRHPLVEIVSSAKVADIPLVGQLLTGETFNEWGPFTIAHSSGRLIVVYIYKTADPSTYGLKYCYTDTDRLTFNEVTISFGAGEFPVFGVSACELDGGNIGLTYFVDDNTNYRLKRRIVTVEGAAVADGEIDAWSRALLTSHTWLGTLPAGTITVGSHAYWRINISANNGSASNTAIDEVEMRATVGGADQCTGGTASASSNLTTYTADKAFDDAETFWVSTESVAWLQYHFASPVNVLQYTVRSRPDGYPGDAPKNWTLEYSDDGAVWIAVKSETDQTAWSAGETRTFSAPDSLAGSPYLMVYAKQSGSNYYIYKRTSADFVTWSAESQLTIAGLTATSKIYSPAIKLLENGDLWLMFGYVDATDGSGAEMTNIYYSVSTDGGGTWSAAVKVTDFTTYAATGNHPAMVQKAADTMLLLYTKQMTVLRMNRSAAGWPNTGGGSGSFDAAWDMHFDLVTRKIYVLNNDLDIGIKPFENVVKIDLDTWEVDQYWTTLTVPAFISPAGMTPQGNGGGAYVPVHTGLYSCDILNGDENVIKHYYFDAASGQPRNVDITNAPLYHLLDVQIHAPSKKAYVTIGVNWSAFFDDLFIVGMIDLTEVISPTESYGWTQLIISPTTDNGWSNSLTVPEEDYYIVNRNRTGMATLDVMIISTGAIWKTYTNGVFSGFPILGLNKVWYFEGFIWGVFTYTTSGGQSERRGLFKLDPYTDAMSYHRPSFASVDDYGITEIIQGEPGILIISCYGYGIAIYDINNDTWQLYNNANIPGMTGNGSNNFRNLAYDPVNKNIVATSSSGSSGEVILFSLYGALKQANYYAGAFSGGAWSFADMGPLVLGLSDYDATAAVDPGNPTSMYVVWENKRLAEQSIMWAKDGSTIDLTPYLLADEEVTIDRRIDGTFNRLEFGCSHGHLFDASNVQSLLAVALRKGRKLAVRWGEMVSGVPYWQPAGVFFVTEAKLVYEKGRYTDIRVVAEDMRAIWADRHIWASDYYDNYPEEIIADLAATFGGLSQSDVDLPVIDNRVLVEHQWLDVPLGEILTQIAERFGYFIRIDADNKLTAGKVGSGAVAHVYPDLSTIIRFEPDDTFSDFTNRVTVIGQEKTPIDVVYPEEKVGQISGTVGWYGYDNNFTIDFSPDRSKSFVNPRLKVVESATSIAFELAGKISEAITYSDPNNRYCIVSVTAPDLTPFLIIAISGVIGTLYLPDGVVGIGGGKTIRLGSAATGIALLSVSMILASIGNFQYEIYGCPLGTIRRSVQGSADDLDSQKEMAVVVEKKLENYLCYSADECRLVASFELLVARLQRRRVKVQKITHLQDEEGDILTMLHPHTGLPLSIYATNLRRRYKMATGPDNGHFLDEIEGWLL